jgi:HEPN domain-containing protein
MQKMSKNKIVAFWLKGAEESLRLASDVFEKKYYSHALFCGHLALEKLLKAKTVTVTDQPAPHTHDLLYLAGLAKIDLNIEQQQLLDTIKKFNIEGRYPEEKLQFYQSVTLDYAKDWLEKINELYLWLSK